MSDGLLDSEPDEIVMNVRAKSPNQAPIADAGAGQEIQVNVEVSLDGSSSTDPEGDSLTYQWTQEGGPRVMLIDSDQAVASFSAPSQGRYVFRLSVNDRELEHFDEVTFIAYSGADTLNTPPVANAGMDQEVDNNTPVTLDGSASTDEEGNELTAPPFTCFECAFDK